MYDTFTLRAWTILAWLVTLSGGDQKVMYSTNPQFTVASNNKVMHMVRFEPGGLPLGYIQREREHNYSLIYDRISL